MSFVQKLKQYILKGYTITKEDAIKLCGEPLNELCDASDELRQHFCGNSFDICTIINGKSGKCSEDCKYCAQSAFYQTQVEEYSLVDNESFIKQGIYNYSKGILRYSMVTSGRNLSDKEIDKVCNSYEKLGDNCGISICASHGLLTFEQFIRLKEAGVKRYHNNLETSRRNFPNICTTHTYDDKINTIKNAQRAGLEVCSGGIIGLGETMEDRIDMILDIRELGIKSVPINILNPIKSTPCEKLPELDDDEICRVIGICRFIIPYGAIRLAGGRALMTDKGKRAFKSGANAAISGDMLTTTGISIKQDIDMLKALNFQVKML